MSYAAVGVGVRIGRATLLEEASVTVAPGELVAVAGPNGAGKSTLVAVLAGDRRPDRGSVQLGGRELHAWPRDELARARAVMGTERDVAFAFSAREVALLGRLPIHGGDPGPADRAVVGALLAAVDCARLADREFMTLSTGERQRVQLARALAQVSDAEEAAEGGPAAQAAEGGPATQAPGTADRLAAASPARYLLLDEPTSSLDPAHQHVAMRLLRRAASRGLGILAVLHDLNLAAAYADRVVLLSRGRVAAAGRPAEVLRSDVLEPVFELPMLVVSHPQVPHPIVIAEPDARSGAAPRS